jgi:rubrerythrin
VLLDLERAAIVAYDEIASPQFGPHERAHADALRRMIGELGGTPAPARPAAEYRSQFPSLRTAREQLSFALDVETTAIGAYADALGKVATDAVRVTLAEIMATESEHAAVILGRLRRPQVPDAFVTGPPPQEEG